jgi:type 1 fimbria pilin
MNKTLNTLFGAMLLASCASAFAASSVDLSVSGTITPSACEPTLSRGGLVDYGKISARDLNADKPTWLPVQTVQFTLTCDGPTLAAIEAKDNREGSDFNNDPYEFGLGLINTNEKLGAMSLQIQRPLADGATVVTIGSENGGSTWTRTPELMRINILTVADTGTVIPKAFQTLVSDLSIEPRIAPTNRLTLTNEVAIDGSVTLSVVYL